MLSNRLIEGKSTAGRPATPVTQICKARDRCGCHHSAELSTSVTAADRRGDPDVVYARLEGNLAVQVRARCSCRALIDQLAAPALLIISNWQLCLLPLAGIV